VKIGSDETTRLETAGSTGSTPGHSGAKANTETEAMLEEELKSTALHVMQQSRKQVGKCLTALTEEELWKDFNRHLVSIGNLLLHLIGNLSQHVLFGLGGIAYTRRRSLEFSDKPGLSKDELYGRFATVVDRAVQVIAHLQPGDLTRRYVIQGHECSGAEDLIIVLEHLSYHTGQIVFAVKYLKDVDFGFYADVDLEQPNAPLR